MNITFPLTRFVREYHLDNHEQVNAHLIQAIREEGGSNSHLSNVKGYMTSWKLALNPESKKYKPLFDLIHSSLYSSFMNLIDKEGFELKLQYTMDALWGAIYGSGDWCDKHVHMPGQMSWIYYCQVPEGSPPLRFDDIDYEFYPEVGDLIMFPGWLNHSVPMYDLQEERIILAGNIKF
jgi:hypothetical protein